MRKLHLKQCEHCGALIKVEKDCHCQCSFICCDSKMEDVVANSTTASFERHIPNYEVNQDLIEVVVDHIMEEDHYIEWIAFVTENTEQFVYFKPNEKAKATFKKEKGTLYAYCNNHGLWEKEVA